MPAAIGEIGGVVKRQVGDRPYYFGTVTSDKLKLLTFVPVIEESRKTYVSERTEEGYQRPGSISRMRLFKRFLDENPNSVVPPILLSSRGKWEFVEGDVADYGTLRVHAPAAIIDGQHRAGGYVLAFEGEKKDDPGRTVPVDFILLVDLDVEEEMKEFVTVNNTQKGVPKSLTAYLEDTDEAQIAWALNTEDDSPFKGRITRTTTQRKHLFALHSVAKQMGRTFDFGTLRELDVPTKVEYAIRYWTIIADVLPEEWSDIEKLDDPEFRGRSSFEFKLLELTGLIAWSLVAKYIVGRSYSDTAGVNWENVRREGQTGEVGGHKIADEMERLLPSEVVAAEAG